MQSAIQHCTAGIGIWDWASNDQGAEPDVVIACAGDPHAPGSGGGRLAPPAFFRPAHSLHQCGGLDGRNLRVNIRTAFRMPLIRCSRSTSRITLRLVHRLTYLSPQEPRQSPCTRVQGRGNDDHSFRHDRLERPGLFHLAADVDRVPRLQRVGAHFKQFLRDKLIDHKEYIVVVGDDMPEIKNWKWPY